MITMSQLGRMGRWGNQVFQYSFLRTYAKRYGLEYQCPAWLGQRLYGFNDPPVTEDLPIRYDTWDKSIDHSSISNYQDAWLPSVPPVGAELDGYDYRAYCQPHMSYYAPDREFIQDLFRGPDDEIFRRVFPVVEYLYGLGRTIVALHMRRGDTGRAIFYLTPNEWYRIWLEENWSRLDNPVLFVASEEPNDVEDFRDFGAMSIMDILELKLDRYPLYNYLSCDLRDPTPGAMDWFPDWYILQRCDVLLFGESTFSFAAAMTNPCLREAWRSRLSIQRFERIDVWDSDTLCREHMDEYPRIPGTYYEYNPKWRGGEVTPQ